MSESLCPEDKIWAMVINGAAENEIVDALSGVYNSASKTSQQNITGAMKNLRGFDFFKSELVYRHTVGLHNGTPVINGASQTGATLNIDGFTASTGTVRVGDKFTIANVNKVHPQTKQDLGVVQQFTITAAATANASGEIAASISPSIDATGPYATVSASPADGAAITWLGTNSTVYPYNLFFHPESTSLVMVDLPVPENVWGAAETYNGITLTMVKAFDIKTRREICRIDALYGIDVIRPSLGGILIG